MLSADHERFGEGDTLKKKLAKLALFLAALFAFALSGALPSTAGPTATGGDPPLSPQVSSAVRHDTSPPLRDIGFQPTPDGRSRAVPVRVPSWLRGRPKPSTPAEDPVTQSAPTRSVTPKPSLTFEGISDDDNAAILGTRFVPPDTNGDVGPNHYVQTVNGLYAVYDKSGTRLLGPAPINHVWSGFGGICQTNNDGDPIVLYDHLSDRWVISQFALGSDGHQCIAVSASPDPTLAYHRYDFVVSPLGTNDYPKLGVWPDAYYLTANQFNSAGFAGAVAVAFERDRMTQGLSALMVKFGPLTCGTVCFFSLQPSHLNGPAPAAGTPNTFVMAFDDQTWGTGTGPDGYRLWDFSVRWTAPAASTFTSLPLVGAPAFDSNLCNFTPCVQQPGGERLDTLSQFTMYRSQYRTFATSPAHSSLVVNHSVDVNGKNRAGVRWAELRKSGSAWTLYQTGTYSPDGNHRWMGSAAMDKAGNIAVGYSVSSRTLFPSIRYATRLAGDLLGTLGTEVVLQAGAGSQVTSFNRWGDYSSMSVDPDGCTFWFTSEYYANTERFDFKTRVGKFAVPGCGP